MFVQMLVIVEMRDRYALAECLEAYTERVGPLLGKTQGLHAAYLAGEEGESTLAIVTLFWTNREAAIAWQERVVEYDCGSAHTGSKYCHPTRNVRSSGSKEGLRDSRRWMDRLSASLRMRSKLRD